MTVSRLALKGDWNEISSVIWTISRVPLKILQVSNTHVDSVGLFPVGRLLRGTIERAIEQDEINIENCYCDLTDLDKENQKKSVHSKQCPVYDFYEIISSFYLEYTPLTIKVDKIDEQRIDIIVEDDYTLLEEERVLYDDERKSNEVIEKELWRVHNGFRAQFPQKNWSMTNWLATEGSVSISFNPIIDFDSSDPNKLEISIGGDYPKKPLYVKFYTLFTLGDIPSRPYTFNLQEHPEGGLDNY